MKALIVLLSLSLAGEAAAREVVLDLTPGELRARGWLRAEAPPPSSDAELTIVNRTPGPATVPVMEIRSPAIGAPTYAIVGEVSHGKLARPGYLEMWNHFPGGKAYFSRALGQGVMRPLAGASTWREFVLPFFNDPNAPDPEALVVNVVFGGPGEVRLRSLRLMRFAPGESPLRGAGPWWDDRTAGLIGAVAGSVIGLLGAIIGSLAGAGRGRGFVFAALRTWAIVGALALVAGLVAVTRQQPYDVYYPLLLIGAMSTAFGLWMPVSLKRRYEATELRKMRAADVIGS